MLRNRKAKCRLRRKMQTSNKNPGGKVGFTFLSLAIGQTLQDFGIPSYEDDMSPFLLKVHLHEIFHFKLV